MEQAAIAAPVQNNILQEKRTMSSNTKAFEEKMKSSVEHLDRELAAVRAGRAHPAVLDK